MKKIILIALVVCCIPLVVRAQIKFANIFSDNMVLQQNRTVTIWGTAPPNSSMKLVCSWEKEKAYYANSDIQGFWQIIVTTPSADLIPHNITLSNNFEELTLINVLLGEVWLCSGQSNMEMVLKNQPQYNMLVEGSDELIAKTNLPMLRFVNIQRKESFKPIDDIAPCQWKEFTDKQIEWLSATGFFFAQKLWSELEIPVGLIVCAYGGSPIQSWIPQSTIEQSPLYTIVRKDRYSELLYENQTEENYVERMKDWIRESEHQSENKYDTILLTLPVNLENSILGNQLGEVSFSKEILLENTSTPLQISLGVVDDFGYVLFNDSIVWSEYRNSKSYSKATFTIPITLLRKGKNTLEVRVLNVLWGGGLTGPAHEMYYNQGNELKVSLCGEWTYKKIFDIADTTPIPKEGKPLFSTASALYNGMLFPLLHYSIKGILWYQGESNIDEANVYTEMSKDLIKAWRLHFGMQTPFYYVQLAPYKYGDANGIQLSKMREAQQAIMKCVSNTGMIFTIDAGMTDNIHPAYKKEVGERLADLALNQTYQMKEPISYPTVESIKQKNNEVFIVLQHVLSGIVMKGSEHCFELSDNNIDFERAKVEVVDYKTIKLTGNSNASYVRYCYKNGDIGTVFNSENMPLNSFSKKIDF